MTPQEQEQAERRQRLEVELANSYREMKQLFAWRDLDEFLDKLVADSNRETDQVPIEVLTVAAVARARGWREAVEKIRNHIGFRTSERPT